MRKLTCVAVAAVLLSQAFVCKAKLTVPTIDDLPVLSLQNAQKTACSRTANYFLRAHYKPVELNKDFAESQINILFIMHSNKRKTEYESVIDLTI